MKEKNWMKIGIREKRRKRGLEHQKAIFFTDHCLLSLYLYLSHSLSLLPTAGVSKEDSLAENQDSKTLFKNGKLDFASFFAAILTTLNWSSF